MVRGLIFVTVDFKWEIQRSRLFGRVLVHDSCRSKLFLLTILVWKFDFFAINSNSSHTRLLVILTDKSLDINFQYSPVSQ